MCEERVGGRAGTAAPQGVVCELPNPPSSSLPKRHANHRAGVASKNHQSMEKWEGSVRSNARGPWGPPSMHLNFKHLRDMRVTRGARLGRHLAPPAYILRVTMLLVAALTLAAAGTEADGRTPAAVDLKPGTLAAFRRYVGLTEARNASELQRGANLLWIDGLPETERVQAYEALKSGQVKMQKLETLDGGEKIRCPGGMIHHWVGAAYVPGAKLPDVLRVLQDYDHHAQYYAPDVERSKIESHEGDHFLLFLRFRRHKVITVVLNTEHEVCYFRDSATRAHSRSSAVRIAEVENAGKNNEREKPPGEDGGYLWGMETWWRMDERDGGVYVQSEVVSLTRDIPAGLGWLIGPFVTSIPKETLTFTLEATRKAALERR